jgi:hypothetical protein
MTSGSTTEAEANHRRRAIAPDLEQQANLAPANPLLVLARARETLIRTTYLVPGRDRYGFRCDRNRTNVSSGARPYAVGGNPDSRVNPPKDAEDNPRAAGGRPAAQPQPDHPPAPAGQQETIAEAGEQPPSGFRSVDGVPLWGDSDGWPRTAHEHAERHAYYTARRDRSYADRFDYNTVVRFGGQTAAEKRAVRHERTRTRSGNRRR